MTVNPRSIAGAATITTLSADLDGSTTTIPLGSTAGWVEVGTGATLGTNGDFAIALDFGQATEEKVYCPAGSLSGTTITGAIRGYEGSGATSHTTGTTTANGVAVIFTATEAKEANGAAVSTSQISGNTGTSTSISAIGTTATPGTSKYAAAADHAHAFAGITDVSQVGYANWTQINDVGANTWVNTYDTSDLTGYSKYLLIHTITIVPRSLAGTTRFIAAPGYSTNGGTTKTFESDWREVTIQVNSVGSPPPYGPSGEMTVMQLVTVAPTANVRFYVRMQYDNGNATNVPDGTVKGHTVVLKFI